VAIGVINRHLWLKGDASGFGGRDPDSFPWFQLSAAFLAVVPSSRRLGRLLDNAPVRFAPSCSGSISGTISSSNWCGCGGAEGHVWHQGWRGVRDHSGFDCGHQRALRLAVLAAYRGAGDPMGAAV